MRWTQQQYADYERRHAAAKARSETLRRGLPPFVGFCEGKEAWSDNDVQVLRDYYAQTLPSEFSIEALANRLHRTFAAVALKASRLGLTVPRNAPRQFSDSHLENLKKAQQAQEWPDERRKQASETTRRYQQVHGHPKGMSGKHHSDSTKQAIAAAHQGKKIPRERVERQMKTRLARYGSLSPRVHRGTSWKAGWVEVGGKRFYSRSLWEANYARYLQWQKERGELKDWEHEATTFWFVGIKRGCVSYLPDFKITTWTNDVEYHEVKGWMDAASKTKIRRMAKYHPLVKLVVVDSVRYKALAKVCKNIIKGWK